MLPQIRIGSDLQRLTSCLLELLPCLLHFPKLLYLYSQVFDLILLSFRGHHWHKQLFVSQAPPPEHRPSRSYPFQDIQSSQCSGCLLFDHFSCYLGSVYTTSQDFKESKLRGRGTQPMLTRLDQLETGHTIRLSIFTFLSSKKHFEIPFQTLFSFIDIYKIPFYIIEK